MQYAKGNLQKTQVERKQESLNFFILHYKITICGVMILSLSSSVPQKVTASHITTCFKDSALSFKYLSFTYDRLRHSSISCHSNSTPIRQYGNDTKRLKL